MPIDPSIALQVKPFQLESPVNALAKMLEVQGAQQQNQLGQAKLDEYTRTKERQNKLLGLVQALPATATDDDRINAMKGGGYFDEADKLQTGMLARQKTGAEVKKDEATAAKTAQETAFKQVEMIGQAMGALRGTQGVTPQHVAAALTQLADMGAIPKEHIQSAIAQIPQNPAELPAWLAHKQQSTMSALDQMRFTTPDANTVASNVQSDKNSLRTASSAAADRSLRASHFNATPKGQIIQTDSGPMLADPRNGTARPVLGPNGQPLAPKMKSLPAPIQKAVMENDAALRKVESALAAVASYPDAFGASNYLGDTIRQRTDPKGVKPRALVADIGSLKLHDRSGAAVTAAETPRLKPFIPDARDDAATVKQKLELFKQEYEAIQSDINETYTPENGYRAPPKRQAPAPAAGGLPDDIAALLSKHGGKK